MTEEERVDWAPAAARPRIRKEFGRRIDVCWQALNSARDRIEPWSGRPAEVGEVNASPDDLITAELARGMKTYAGAIELCSVGFGQQAAMLCRSLFEGMAIAHWIHARPIKAMAVFARAERFQNHLLAEQVEKVGWELPQQQRAALDGARLAPAELAPLKAEFGGHGGKLWTGRSLHTIVGEIEEQWDEGAGRDQLWEYFRIAHRDNNQILHSSTIGMARAVLAIEPTARRLEVGASPEHVAQALLAAHWCFTNLFTLMLDRFGFRDPEEFREEIRQQHFDLWMSEPEQFADVQRNDRCPCLSGRKFKYCHQDKVLDPSGSLGGAQ